MRQERYAAVRQLLPSVVGEDKDLFAVLGPGAGQLDNLSRLPAAGMAARIDFGVARGGRQLGTAVGVFARGRLPGAQRRVQATGLRL
ncbi:hypothetical protein C7821_104247 [Streptomyces sp. VMFN-G11Ma]|nr:hypothetical protein C7821_104247 [Streptomyces sp. VMFN-G11Ma]